MTTLKPPNFVISKYKHAKRINAASSMTQSKDPPTRFYFFNQITITKIF